MLVMFVHRSVKLTNLHWVTRWLTSHWEKPHKRKNVDKSYTISKPPPNCCSPIHKMNFSYISNLGLACKQRTKS